MYSELASKLADNKNGTEGLIDVITDLLTDDPITRQRTRDLIEQHLYSANDLPSQLVKILEDDLSCMRSEKRELQKEVFELTNELEKIEQKGGPDELERHGKSGERTNGD